MDEDGGGWDGEWREGGGTKEKGRMRGDGEGRKGKGRDIFFFQISSNGLVKVQVCETSLVFYVHRFVFFSFILFF